MYTSHSSPSRAAAVADATPCWPAPVSALGEQRLAEHVVDLVRAGVAEIFSLEIDARAAAVPGEALGEVERGGPPRVVPEEIAEPAPEAGILARGVEGTLQLDERRHEGLGDEAAAEAAEVAGGIG
jgi:hypothetical protein